MLNEDNKCLDFMDTINGIYGFLFFFNGLKIKMKCNGKRCFSICVLFLNFVLIILFSPVFHRRSLLCNKNLCKLIFIREYKYLRSVCCDANIGNRDLWKGDYRISR